MRRVEKLFVGLLALCACVAGANCPYINTATAAGVLDGSVHSTASAHACEFVRSGAPEYKLRLAVSPISAPTSWSATKALSCGGAQAIPLRAIGNEAASCVKRVGNRIYEETAGRVRDQQFVIRIDTDDRSASDAALLEKARMVAEQVSGNLF